MAIPNKAEAHVTVPGGRIYLRQWSISRPAGCPIILLHDSLGSVEQWRNFPASLATETNRCVIAYDRLGFGRSTPRLGLPSPEFVADEADTVFPALMEAIGVESFVPFGHSVGGGMALAVAAASGKKCEAVISESAQAFVEPLTLAAIRAAESRFSRRDDFARIERWHGRKAQWVLDAWVKVWLSPQFAHWNLDSHLERIQCPVLAIHGKRDEFGSLAFPRRITAGVNGPAEQAILDCGHVPHREQEQEVLRLTGSFLRHHRRSQ